VPEANRPFAAKRMGVAATSIRGLDAGESVAVQGFTFHAVPAAHEDLDRDAQGRHIYLGYVLKFGPWTVYHSGDTLLYPGMVELLRPFKIDVALLPINGRAPERRVAGNLSGPEAAQLAHDIGARCVIPCHYDMFEFNTASPDAFVATCRQLGQPFQVLQAGARWSSKQLDR
jgi:L-ascorbate metabolism protein UlaG (beta-lactamase superfamily)